MHWVLEKTEADLEQAFNFGNSFSIHQEQNDVIVGLNDDVIMGNYYFVISDDGADSGSLGQIDVFDCTSYDP